MLDHLLFAIICLAWGSGFFLMKVAGAAFGPISVGAWRVALGAAVVAVWWFLHRRAWPIRGRQWVHVCFVVLVSFIYPFCMQPHLIGKYGQSGFIGMMVSLVPLLTVIVSIPMLRILPSRMEIIGVVGGLICFALVFYDGKYEHDFSTVDLLLATLVPLCYAVANTYIKRNLSKVPATELTLAATILATLVLMPVALATEPVKFGDAFLLAALALLGVGVVCTGLASVLFYKLVQDRGPLFAGMVTYVIPVLAIALGSADKEKLSLLQVIALGGIFAMVALVQFSPKAIPAPSPSQGEGGRVREAG